MILLYDAKHKFIGRIDAPKARLAPGLDARDVHDRFAASQAAGQPHLFAKLRELLEEDVREAAMTAEVAATIFRPTQVAVDDLNRVTFTLKASTDVAESSSELARSAMKLGLA